MKLAQELWHDMDTGKYYIFINGEQQETNCFGMPKVTFNPEITGQRNYKIRYKAKKSSSVYELPSPMKVCVQTFSPSKIIRNKPKPHAKRSNSVLSLESEKSYMPSNLPKISNNILNKNIQKSLTLSSPKNTHPSLIFSHETSPKKFTDFIEDL